MIEPQLENHNLHQVIDLETFTNQDPNLRRLARLPLVFESALMDQLPLSEPGIYTLGGGRQIGKTTLVKQIMKRLLTEYRVEPAQIMYLTGEIFQTPEALEGAIVRFLKATEPSGMNYLFLDEATYVPHWDRTVKYLADLGYLERTFLLITGSDLVMIEDALKRLPGRRGKAEVVDYLYYPLSFGQWCHLKSEIDKDTLAKLSDGPPAAPVHPDDAGAIETLLREFEEYLLTGGYLTAINEFKVENRIHSATRRIYSDWIRGDVLRHGKTEHYLFEVLGAIVKRYGTQITWNALARDLSIDHPKTVADYVALLERMAAAFVVPALREDRLSAAPKKARKLYFADPFIYHCLSELVDGPASVPSTIEDLRAAPKTLGRLAEATLLAHAWRRAPTFYIKGTGEVDCAYVEGSRFWPIEVKWTGQVRRGDLKQLRKYEDGVIAARVSQEHEIESVRILPLPVVLLRLDAEATTLDNPIG